MHKSFYASGFLYHSPSQQILLQHITKKDYLLSLFAGHSTNGETPSVVFKRVIMETLGINLPLEAINPVYDYFYEKIGTNHYVQYAEVHNKDLFSDLHQKGVVEWFPILKISKLKLSSQEKHDIIIGQRVIRAAEESKYKEEINTLST